MQTIHTEGPEYYGWGQVFCQTCKGGKGKELAKEYYGYDNVALTVAQIGTLVRIAEDHARQEPSHAVRVYTFARASETRQTGW